MSRIHEALKKAEEQRGAEQAAHIASPVPPAPDEVRVDSVA